MAIVAEAPGLEVQICVDGNPLQEYIDRYTAVSEATSESYIEARSDSGFEIHYSFRTPFPTDRPVSMIITMDGKDLDEPLVRPEDLYGTDGHVSSGPISNDGSSWFTQAYLFSPLKISKSTSDSTECQSTDTCTGEWSEGPVSEDLLNKLQHIGIITCEFYFLENARHNPNTGFLHKELEKLDKVNEKAIKGESLSHQAVYVWLALHKKTS
jgi:hypothetical protein